MKKTKKTILLLIISFGLFFNCINLVKADTKTTRLYKTGLSGYSSEIADSTTYWEAYKFYTSDRTSSVFNAHCIFPKARSLSYGLSVTAEDVTEDSEFEYIKRVLYWGYGGPGWTSSYMTSTNRVHEAIAQICNSNAFHGNCDDEDLYVMEHLVLSYYASIDLDSRPNQPTNDEVFYGTNSFFEYLITNTGFRHGRDQLPAVPAADEDTFKVWYIQSESGYQNFVYWTNGTPQPEYGGIKFAKTFSATGTYSDTSTYHFKYKVTGPGIDDYEDVYTDDNGYVTYPTDGSLTLEVGDSYYFCEYWNTSTHQAATYDSNHEFIEYSDYIPESSCQRYREVANPSADVKSYPNTKVNKYIIL